MSRTNPGPPPANGQAGETLRSLLEYAILAPSGHNTQPWLFCPTEEGVDIYADRGRALPVADPEDREMVISCGAALFHLRVAARNTGMTPSVEPFPDQSNRDLLARVRLAQGPPPTADELRLFRAIPVRRTNWLSFENRSVPPDLPARLVEEAEAEGVGLRFLEASQREPVRALIMEADRRLDVDEDYRREMVMWLGDDESERSGSGMPLYPEDIGLSVAYDSPLPSAVPISDLVAAHHGRLAEQASRIAILYTAGSSPDDWLRAGQALDRVLLSAAADGVSASFLSGPIQVDNLTPALRTLLGGDVQYPQMVLGLGYAPPRDRRTPRRPLDESLRSEPPPRRSEIQE